MMIFMFKVFWLYIATILNGSRSLGYDLQITMIINSSGIMGCCYFVLQIHVVNYANFLVATQG